MDGIVLKRTQYQGVIYVVDSNDRERIGEAREELTKILADDELRQAVLLIFANKQVQRIKLSANVSVMMIDDWIIGSAQRDDCCWNHW